jgi:DNA-binding MarR family transcriptional regulator
VISGLAPPKAEAPEFVGLLIASARRRIKQAVLARAAHHQLAPQQFWLLVALQENPGLAQVELAERMHADPPTVSRVISSLSRRRLVRTESDQRDRRKMKLRLTVAGERLARELCGSAAEIRGALVLGMSSKEQDALRAALRRVIANLERLESHRLSRDPERTTP